MSTLALCSLILCTCLYYYVYYYTQAAYELIVRKPIEPVEVNLVNISGRVNYVNITNLPVIYVITPTYRRAEQIAELTRVAQTFMLVDNLHWIVVEDATVENQQVKDLLNATGLPYTYLLGKACRHSE